MPTEFSAAGLQADEPDFLETVRGIRAASNQCRLQTRPARGHYIRGLQAVALFRDRLRMDRFVDRGAIDIGTLKVQIIRQPSKCCSTETRDQIIHNDCSEHAAALQQDQPTVDNKHLSVMQFYQCGNDFCQVTWRGVPGIQQIFRYAWWCLCRDGNNDFDHCSACAWTLQRRVANLLFFENCPADMTIHQYGVLLEQKRISTRLAHLGRQK